MRKTVIYAVVISVLFLFGCNSMVNDNAENMGNGTLPPEESSVQPAEENENVDIETTDFECLYLVSEGTSTNVGVTECDVTIAGYGMYSVPHSGIIPYCELKNGDGAYLISLNVNADSITVLSWDADMWAAGIVNDGVPVELNDGTAVFGGRNIYCISVEWYEDNPLCSGKAEYWFAVCEFIN